MLDGGTIRAAEALTVPKEGSHRSLSAPPNFNREACIDCVLCLTVCPDPGALVWREDKMAGIDRAYCKACMRCVAVCAMTKKGRALTAP